MQPTLLADVGADYECWQEEIFGPVLAIRTFKDEEEAIHSANDNQYVVPQTENG